jgi:hypothetical protein
VPIDISPAPDLYLVEFTFGRQPNERVSIIIPASCGLAAMTGAWALFPEYKRRSKRTHVHQVKYVELDWLNGRTIVVKQERQPYIPTCETNKRIRKKKHNEEETQ